MLTIGKSMLLQSMKDRDTWTTSEILLVASSFIRESKDDTYSAGIPKFTSRTEAITILSAIIYADKEITVQSIVKSIPGLRLI